MGKRPYRTELFAKFAEEITAACPSDVRVLELGSGPGFLAECILRTLPESTCVLLDISPAMHTLAATRLGDLNDRAEFIQRSFKEDHWNSGLGDFKCVVTNQAVHELRHKRHAPTLHSQVQSILQSGGSYFVCDHFCGDGGMSNGELYMTVEEQKEALLIAGFKSVREVALTGSLVLHHAVC